MLLKELEAIKEGVKAIKIDENKREKSKFLLFLIPIVFVSCMKVEWGEMKKDFTIEPIYKEAIKVVDPLENFKKSDGIADYVNY